MELSNSFSSFVPYALLHAATMWQKQQTSLQDILESPALARLFEIEQLVHQLELQGLLVVGRST